MPVEILFPVAIGVFDLDPALVAATRSRVKDYLASEAGRRDLRPSPTETLESTRFSGRSVVADAGLEPLAQAVVSCAEQLIAWFGVAGCRLEIERDWVNVYRTGMQQTEHAHEGSVASAVYYVQGGPESGDLVFQDPVAARRAHRAFTRTNAQTRQATGQMSYPPQPGRLLVFESWLPHAVAGNKSAEARISVALDLRRRA